MEVIHKRVAGLDVHKATVVACVRLMANRKVSRECRTFATTTEGLLALLAWLTECRCTCRDGGDRGILDAGVEDSERGRVRTDGRQRRTHQAGSRPQDGHERCDVYR